jgi:hypothetical protein
MKHTALLLLSLVCLQSSAQDRGLRSEGREFYLGYLHPRYVLGNEVAVRTFGKQLPGTVSLSLDLSLVPGAYTAIVTIGGETLSHKLILE